MAEVNDALAKAAFLEHAKLDAAHYEGMTVQQAIAAAMKERHMEVADFSKKMNNLHAPQVRQLMAGADFLEEGTPTNAIKLGVAMRKLIDNPHPMLAKRQAKIAAAEADQQRLRALFFDKCGITDTKPYETYATTSVVMKSVYDLLYLNVHLTLEQIGQDFKPPVSAGFVLSRLNGRVDPDEHFVENYARIVQPLLEVGVHNAWLDEKSKRPRPFEDILVDAGGIKPELLEEKKGTEAVWHAVELSGVPNRAIGPMIGYDAKWLLGIKSAASHRQTASPRTRHSTAIDSAGDTTRQPATKVLGGGRRSDPELRMMPVQIAAIARNLAPYLHKERQWTGVLPVSDPVFLQNHQTCKQYLQGKLKTVAGIPVREVDAFFAYRPDTTLGPLIRELRYGIEGVFLSQDDLKPVVQQTDIDRVEANCFNPYCVKADGTPSDFMRRILDRVALVIGYHWKEYGIKPEVLVNAPKVTPTRTAREIQ